MMNETAACYSQAKPAEVWVPVLERWANSRVEPYGLSFPSRFKKPCDSELLYKLVEVIKAPTLLLYR